ncbi:MAG: hypothetical protein R3E96_06980 [Planctomycetota bacterium]
MGGAPPGSAEYTSDEDGGKLVLNIDPDREVRLKLGDPETGTETLNLHFGTDRDPVRIPCPVGPTLLLDLELPAGYGYEDLVAGLQDPSDRFEALRPKPASSGSVHPPPRGRGPSLSVGTLR